MQKIPIKNCFLIYSSQSKMKIVKMKNIDLFAKNDDKKNAYLN